MRAKPAGTPWGTTVSGGMIAPMVLKLFFIPVLYLVIEVARERMGAKTRR